MRMKDSKNVAATDYVAVLRARAQEAADTGQAFHASPLSLTELHNRSNIQAWRQRQVDLLLNAPSKPLPAPPPVWSLVLDRVRRSFEKCRRNLSFLNHA